MACPHEARENKAITGVGDIKYIDKDGDGKISAPNDLEYLGTTTPRYTFGLNLTAAWKGFDLGVLLQGVRQKKFLSVERSDEPVLRYLE